jgi:hypothetical protein
LTQVGIVNAEKQSRTKIVSLFPIVATNYVVFQNIRREMTIAEDRILSNQHQTEDTIFV